ncbi:HlyD family type I secretion periplasmic adaptor subunit [Vibrio methylphosphonaticus]|uniref:HlyD family type I secretion periplasmic adaptor subunit n=1 Tax=Vibrio methylphosphonaticus TaxID=2946866 RepID=UPI00202A9722|nr:HlyD family type I secretion periplasmic adaptor subunit [Vibrio methylphosphonaticus]MCL9776817.1 HlyD family type I secretion periplasmic adaptor subunit [Vibrio methylphosphonaticus]
MSKSSIEHHIKNALIRNGEKSESDYVEALEIKSAMTVIHKTLLLTFFIILILLVIASQARIDIVVSSRGELLLESDIERVQHLEGGILDAMLVKPGDIVYEKQPIARLRALERNSQLSTANIEIAQLEMDKLRYKHLINQSLPDFSAYAAFPELVKVNQQTWKQENDKNISAEALIQHDINHKKRLIGSMKKRKVSSLNQLKLIRKQLEIKQTLYREEMASYVDVLNMQVQESNMVREIENLDESLMNEDFQLIRLDKQLNDLIVNRNAEYQAQMIQSNKDLDIKKIQQPQHSDKVERLVVYSPVDGVVDKVHFNFRSAVIPPGESIADIAPLNNTLHGEAKIPRKEMGFVEVGQEVKLKFDTYNFAKYGFMAGTITSISRSSYEEEETEYYLAKITIKHDYLERSGTKYSLSPYMEFTADIKTGDRRVIEYAAKPVMSAIEDAFDER